MSTNSPDSIGWPNIKISNRIYTRDVMPSVRTTMYTMYTAVFQRLPEPMNLTVGSVRTLKRLARSMGKQLMIDSAEIARQLFDSTVQAQLGYTENLARSFHSRKPTKYTGI